MRKLFASMGMILATAWVTHAQIGKAVVVPAGSPEDAAVSAIYAAKAPAQKISLLNQFAANHPTGDFALLADQLYVSAYASEKNYAQVYVFGDKALAIDPDNFETAVNLVRVADDAGDSAKVFHYGGIVAAIITRFKARPAPAGTPAAEWKQKQSDTLGKVQADLQSVEYIYYATALKTADPATKAQWLAQFVSSFPASQYAEDAQVAEVFAYQAAKDDSKMLDAAHAVLKRDPKNATVLVLLADYWSDQEKELTEAETDAQTALTALAAATKPPGVTEAVWQTRLALQKGIALSALGQVYLIRRRYEPAVAKFEQASPLLKSNDFSYGRNLYRWGFALAKMRRIREARRILTEAMEVKGPYQSVAERAVNQIGGPLRSRRRR